MKARVLVGRNIRRLRVARQLPQEALGVAAGIEPSYVGRIERGRENVTVDLLEAIAAVLGVEVGAFFMEPGGDLLPGLRAGRKPRAGHVSGGPMPPGDGRLEASPSSATASAPTGSNKTVEGA